jgi:hypothetical protein
VKEKKRKGKEIEVNYIKKNEDEKLWRKEKVEDWEKEMDGKRIIIEKLEKIKENRVVGVREK